MKIENTEIEVKDYYRHLDTISKEQLLLELHNIYYNTNIDNSVDKVAGILFSARFGTEDSSIINGNNYSYRYDLVSMRDIFNRFRSYAYNPKENFFGKYDV